jgi:alkylation response protein AidB-like acyl-CoA dehydrogenase
MLYGSTAPRLANPTMVALLDEVRERRDEFEKLTYVPPDIVQKLQAVGIYRAFVPKEFGGDELSPSEFLEMIELLSTADASTGWVASFGVSSTYLAALPPEVFKQIYRTDPDTVFAGAIFPPQRAEKVAGGSRYLAAGLIARAAWVHR